MLQRYLEKYNFTEHSTSPVGQLVTSRYSKFEDIRDALGDFQAMYDLKVTRRLDAATKRLMRKARCGNVDIRTKAQRRRLRNKKRNKKRRNKRFVIKGW